MGGVAGDAGTPGTLPPKTYREGGGGVCVNWGISAGALGIEPEQEVKSPKNKSAPGWVVAW